MPEDTQKEVITRGIKSFLLDAKIPMRHHLKVVEALHKAMVDHSKERAAHEAQMQAMSNQLAQHSAHRDTATKMVGGYEREVQRLTSIEHLKGDQGEPGESGKDGVTPTMEEIVNAVLPRIPKPKDATAKDGKDGASVDVNTLVTAVIKELQKGDKLHISQIRGGAGFIKDGIKYRFEEFMHGGGNSTAGSSTYYTPTGTVNAVNQVFATTAQPKSVVADGITYFEGAGYSYSAPNITMDVAPSQYIRYTK